MEVSANNGIVRLDSKQAKLLGFTSDKFEGWLWRKGNNIMISFIVSLKPGRGNLSKLFERIWAQGHLVKVPTPCARMRAILRKKGFKQTQEHDDILDLVEVWVK